MAELSSDDYEENDCNLSSGLDPRGCDAVKW